MPILKDKVVEFVFKEQVIIDDYSTFVEGTRSNRLLRLNQDNYRGGLVRITNTIKTIDRIEELLNSELNK